MPTGFGYAGTLSSTGSTAKTKAKKKSSSVTQTVNPTYKLPQAQTLRRLGEDIMPSNAAYTGQTIGYTPTSGGSIGQYVPPTYTPPIAAGQGPGSGNFTLATSNTPPGQAAAANAGVTGGVGGVPGAGNATNMMAPFTGYAKAFRPEAAPGIFQDPQIMLQQVMRQNGINPQSAQGLYQMGLPFADYANALSMLSLGGVGQDQFANGSVNNALNFMGNYFNQLQTPGGQGVDFNAGLRALQHGGGNDTVLGNFLNVDNPADQIKNFKSLALPLAAAGLSPLFARAFENAVNQQGDQYLWSISGPGSAQSNFTNYFNKNSSLF